MKKDAKNVKNFDNLGIDEKILSTLKRKRFETPTPIQHQVIPDALNGKDIVGIAQTGTGKTLAFGIPMIQRIAQTNGQGLILAPTRELAVQIEQSLQPIASALHMTCTVIIGGVSQHAQVKALRRDPHIIIATPGRLADLMNQRLCRLDHINILTLDEGDRMLDMGFLPQIKRILQTVKKNRQTMLFSATMPRTISSLASEFMKLPLRIEIAPQGTSCENTEQEAFVVKKNDKMRLLDAILEKYDNETVLLFSRTKHGAKRIARDIRGMRHTATEIHSNRSQSQRKIALEGFKNGKFRIMVATDIAARGIDVKDIGLVINFDLPDSLEDYVHRIGRTGRAGSYGKAISFVTPPQKADVRKIERLIHKSLPLLALPALPPERERAVYNDKNYKPTDNNYSNNNQNRNFYQKNRGRSSANYKGNTQYNRRRTGR